jgi:hypothetical protein
VHGTTVLAMVSHAVPYLANHAVLPIARTSKYMPANPAKMHSANSPNSAPRLLLLDLWQTRDYRMASQNEQNEHNGNAQHTIQQLSYTSHACAGLDAAESPLQMTELAAASHPP